EVRQRHRRAETNHAADHPIQIAALIGDLSWSVDILTTDIEHEEARAGVRNLSDPAYPVLARSLRARRENGNSSGTAAPYEKGAVFYRGLGSLPNKHLKRKENSSTVS